MQSSKGHSPTAACTARMLSMASKTWPPQSLGQPKAFARLLAGSDIYCCSSTETSARAA